MGEAWSDWYALDFLARRGLPARRPGARRRQGGRVRRQRAEPDPDRADGLPAGHAGHRRVPGLRGDRARRLHLPGLRPDRARRARRRALPEPHADGEIWAQTLWQLRQRLVARYGQVGGSNRAERYITGGMRLGPPQPSFLDQRNAILQASTLAGGADTSLIWEVFASRGMGYFASTKGDFDYEPDADFSVPPTGSSTGIVRGVVRGDNGQPIPGARRRPRRPRRPAERGPGAAVDHRGRRQLQDHRHPAGRVPAAHRRGAGRLRGRVRRRRSRSAARW